MSDQERAVVFGRDAASYESARPSYPREAIEHLVALADPLLAAIEVGPGTGKATEGVARPGVDLIGLEPDPDMARLLEGKALPGVRVDVSRFEDWEGSVSDVDLIYAAQAWHWVDAEVGYELARRLLRPSGVLALMWNIPEHRYDQFEDVYRRHAPHILDEHDERIRRRDRHDWSIDLARAGFGDVARFTTRWSTELDGAEFRTLYSTYSDHMLIPDQPRHRLLDALEATVDSRGGSVMISYRTEVFSGRA